MKHLYSLIVLVCLAASGQSQINSYFNNNPCWQQQSTCQVGQNCYTVNIYNYFINGDTLIGGYQYKQVYKKGYSYTQSGPQPVGNPCLSPPPTYYYSGALNFFIRSSNKKIFIRNLGPSQPDTLLYDFNLIVGSTLPLTYNNPWSSYTFTVSAIDSINTFNGWVKRFKLNSNPNFNFIEGMGYVNGLVELMPPNVMSCGWSLQCYSQNNSAYFPSSGPSCLLSTEIKGISKPLNPIIYPNPSEGKYQVWLPEFSINSKIEIYNSIGQLIRSFTPLSESLELDIQKEKAGIYFLKYISNGETKSVKLVKE